jgi:hypothetical protein
VSKKKDLQEAATLLMDMGMIIVSIDYKSGTITCKPIPTRKFITNVWRVLDSAGNLLIRKHHDYGPKNVAHSPGGPLNGLRVRMWDKVARINNLVDSKVNPSNESLRDSFIDLLNYSAIAIMVLDKTWPELRND